MKKKALVGFLFILSWVDVFFLPIPRAGGAPSATGEDCPSCSAFGVQRFPEKKPAPPFCLKALDGKTSCLNDYKGKPVLLVFWATWCPSCREDISSMEKFSADKRDQFTILLIAIDGERQKKVERIIRENHITLPVLLVLKEKIMDSYGVRGWMPLTFLVDAEGMLVGKIVGERDWCSPQAWSVLKELFSLR